MFCNFRLVKLAFYGFCAAFALGLIGACSSEHYKAEADEEVYEIIDSKWRDKFGQRVNYTIGDVTPSPNDLQIEKDLLPSEPLSLAQAVAMATAYNRDYQTEKEELYKIALDLTLERHSFKAQWFGTFDSTYARDADDETLTHEGELGFEQLLADGAQISASIAYDWLRYLTGDPRASIGSVLSATITQPLLRGAGRKIARETLTQAERDTLYRIRTFNRYRKEFVVSIVNDYYRVLQQRDAVTNAENNYKRS